MSTQERSTQRSNRNKPESIKNRDGSYAGKDATRAPENKPETSRANFRNNTNEDERIDPSYKRTKENKTPTDSKRARPTTDTHNAATVNR